MNNHKGENDEHEGGTDMSGPRKLYEFFMAASVAHAKWDYEVSMSIIKNR